MNDQTDQPDDVGDLEADTDDVVGGLATFRPITRSKTFGGTTGQRSSSVRGGRSFVLRGFTLTRSGRRKRPGS